MTSMMGPTLPISEEIDKMKYRGDGEDFAGKVYRISATLADNDDHRVALKDILGNMRFLPAGRVQTDIGSPRQVTAFNCFRQRHHRRLDVIHHGEGNRGRRDHAPWRWNRIRLQSHPSAW